jgi:hypothetical protein
MPTSFGAVGHYRLLLVLSLLFVTLFNVALDEPLLLRPLGLCFCKPSINLRFSNAYSLKQSRVDAQLDTDSRRLSKSGTGRYERLCNSADGLAALGPPSIEAIYDARIMNADIFFRLA